MTEREKVIKGLECCARDYGQCGNCPYDDFGAGRKGCGWRLYEDALALLKAHKPRVMTREEAISAKFGYLENDIYKHMRVFIYPGWDGLKYNVHMRAYIGCEALDMPVTDYNKTWRCWTSQPTDEQREATPWES